MRLVVDNGAGVVKMGEAGDEAPWLSAPNCVVKHRTGRFQALGPAINALDDHGGLATKRPFERGYLTNIDLQRDIWSECFSHLTDLSSGGDVFHPEHNELMVTEPYLNPPALMSLLDELVFEELGFDAACFGHPAALSMLSPGINRSHAVEPQLSALGASTGVVIDAGFSFCHAVPVVEGRVFLPAIKRLDLGGKALANCLKEQISFRHVNIMEEFLLAEEAMQHVCFVSQRVERNLALCRRPKRSPLRIDWVLPDGVNLLRGKIADTSTSTTSMNASSKQALQQQTFPLANERFLTPEILFSPTDIGLYEQGLPQVVHDAVQSCPRFLQRPLLANVVITGGLANLPGFEMRLARELRSLTPTEDAMYVATASTPAEAAWRGASAFAASEKFDQHKITKRDYIETGSRQQHYERLAESEEFERAAGRVT